MSKIELTENDNIRNFTKKMIAKSPSPSKLNLSSKTRAAPSVEFLLKQVYYSHRTNVKALEQSLSTSNQHVEELQEEIKGLKDIVIGLENDKQALQAANLELEQQLDEIRSGNTNKSKEGIRSCLDDSELFKEKSHPKKDALKLMRSKRHCLYNENNVPTKRIRIDKEDADSMTFTGTISRPKVDLCDLVANTVFALDTCDPRNGNFCPNDESCEPSTSFTVEQDACIVPETMTVDNDKVILDKDVVNTSYNEKKTQVSSQEKFSTEKFAEIFTKKIKNKNSNLKTPPLFEDVLEISANNDSSLMNISDHKSPILNWPVKTVNNQTIVSCDLKKNTLLKTHEVRTNNQIASSVICPEVVSTNKNSHVEKIIVNNNHDIVDIWIDTKGGFQSLKKKEDFLTSGDDLHSKQFSSIPENKGDPPFKYVEDVVRNHAERKKLQGFSCKSCQAFYENMPKEDRVKHLKDCSRHRAKFLPPKTPDHYWSIGFPDTQECKERGYMNVTQKKPLLARRKRPLRKL